MPSCNICVYRGCDNSSRRNKDLIFHRVSSPLWIDYMGNEELRKLTPSQLRERRICSAHFRESDYAFFGTGRKKRIKHGAAPVDIRTIEKSTTPALSDDESNCTQNISSTATVKEEPSNDHSENMSCVESEELKHELDQVYMKLDCNELEFDTQRLELENLRIQLYTERAKFAKQRVLLCKQQQQMKLLQRKICRLKRNVQNYRAERKSTKLSIDEVIEGARQHLNDEELHVVKMILQRSRQHPPVQDMQQLVSPIYTQRPTVYQFLTKNTLLKLPCIKLVKK